MTALPRPASPRSCRTGSGFDYHRSEAYQLVRVLTGACSTLPGDEDLRHAAVAATRHLADGMLVRDAEQMQAHFAEALASLRELARQVDDAREAGRLPDDLAALLLDCQARATRAVRSVARRDDEPGDDEQGEAALGAGASLDAVS